MQTNITMDILCKLSSDYFDYVRVIVIPKCSYWQYYTYATWLKIPSAVEVNIMDFQTLHIKINNIVNYVSSLKLKDQKINDYHKQIKYVFDMYISNINECDKYLKLKQEVAILKSLNGISLGGNFNIGSD